MSCHDIKDIPLADETDTDIVAAPGIRPKPAPPLPSTNTFNGKSEEELEDMEEKVRLISQVLELQNTLDDLSQRVDNVKEESLKLKSENQVLGQYIQNLMSTSAVFHSTSTPPKRALK